MTIDAGEEHPAAPPLPVALPLTPEGAGLQA
jgi:hypothetical protein